MHQVTDNSPTTGSVTTTVAEKQRLAKSSLAFNCKNPSFRKLFPEYVEKYEQQLSEKPLSEQVSPVLAKHESSKLPLEKPGDPVREHLNRVGEAPKETENQRRQPFPTWGMVLLVSVFGVVMALPLLQP